MPVEALRSRIGSALANRDYAEVEGAWREYAGLHPEDHAYLRGVAEQLGRYEKSALGAQLCLGLAEALLERGEEEAAYVTARAALRMNQRIEGLRELLREVYRRRHGDCPHLDAFLEKSGVAASDGPLRQQVDNLDRYLTFEEGAYVYHRGGWGHGVVTDFDPDAEEMVVDFERKRGHRIGLLSATKILERLPDRHIGVYLHYRRDELARLAEEDPVKVFRIFLASHGRSATLKQVREALVPALMDKDAWSRFWTRAKKALVKDPEFRVGKGSSPLLEVRDRAKPVEDEVADRMRARSSGLGKVSVAREYLRTLDLTPTLAEAIGGQVDEALADAQGSDRLALLLLKADLGGPEAKAAEEEGARLALDAPDLVKLLEPLEPSDRKRALGQLADAGPEGWAERLAGILRSGDAEVADLVLDLLHERRPDVLTALFRELSASPADNPQLFLWYVRGVLQQSIPPELTGEETAATAMEKLLTLTNTIGLEQKRTGDADLKEFLRQVRSFLTSRRLKLFDEFVAKVPLDYARFLHSKVLRNRGITDQTKQMLLDSIEAHHPKIHVSPEPEGEEDRFAIPEDVLYTTLAGYHRKEAELRHLVEVEVPENAADLGRAASFGDISENAEYSAALEKQGMLMRRVQELRSDLERARILDPSHVRTDRVAIGSRVKLNNLSRNVEETFSILGPWDIDLERGIISYLSPVGRGLLGKERGAETEIVLPEGSVRYRVLDIDAAPALHDRPEGE